MALRQLGRVLSLHREKTSVDTTPEIHPTARHRAFEILEHGRRRDLGSRTLDSVLVLLIVTNVAAVIARCLAKDPADRVQSAADLDRALGQCSCASHRPTGTAVELSAEQKY